MSRGAPSDGRALGPPSDGSPDDTATEDRTAKNVTEPSFRAQVVEMEGGPEERKRAHSDVRELSTAVGQRARSAA